MTLEYDWLGRVKSVCISFLPQAPEAIAGSATTSSLKSTFEEMDVPFHGLSGWFAHLVCVGLKVTGLSFRHWQPPPGADFLSDLVDHAPWMWRFLDGSAGLTGAAHGHQPGPKRE
jgi:hypothetical protein